MLAVCRSLLALTLLLLLAAAGCKKPQDATPDKANLELQLPETADPPSWAADRVSRLKIDGKDYSEPRGTKRLLEVKPGEANEVTVVYTFWPNTYTKIIRTKVVKLDPTKRTVASLLTEDPATPDQIQPIYVPTPEETVEQMCEMAKIGKDDVVYDIGCGDGRLVIMAVQKFGAKKAVGIDIDADLIKLCKKNAEKAGVSDKVTFEAKDAQKIKDFSEASVVLLYIGDYLGEALRPTLRGTLKKGARIVSNRFKMGDWRPDRSELIKHKDNTSKHELHLWTIK